MFAPLLPPPPLQRHRYDRPYPYLSWYQPLPISRLVLRNYRRKSANTANEYLEDPRAFCGGRGWGKEGEEVEDRTGRGSRTTCPLLASGIENFVKRGRRRVPGCGILGRRRARGRGGEGRTQRRRDVFTKQFGTKSPLWRRVSCAHKRMDNGGRSVKRARQNGERQARRSRRFAEFCYV